VEREEERKRKRWLRRERELYYCEDLPDRLALLYQHLHHVSNGVLGLSRTQTPTYTHTHTHTHTHVISRPTYTITVSL
jgi:hypothetical protein